MNASTRTSPLHVALVHDWLTGMRGGEKCLEVLCELFPQAPLYSLLHVPGSVTAVIENRTIVTSFLQRLPGAEHHYRRYLPLFPLAIETLDLSKFDVVISTSHAVAKGARVRAGGLHICYCHTPMRYVWDQYEEYFGKGRAGLATRLAMSVAAPYLRGWDVRTASRVDRYIANSHNVRERIRRIYQRESEVIYPPVDVSMYDLGSETRSGYLMVTALVPYKRVDLAIQAFNRSGKKLTIVGKGPETQALKAMAGPNIEFLGWRSDKELAVLYRSAEALIFPGEEDFGIVPLEAMASGTPVVAYGRGGALETVVEGGTGIFFRELSTDALQEAVSRASQTVWNREHIRQRAMQFSRARYREEMAGAIERNVFETFGRRH